MHKMLLLSTEEHLVIVVKLEDHPQVGGSNVGIKYDIVNAHLLIWKLV
jgi:hypothetical protein